MPERIAAIVSDMMTASSNAVMYTAAHPSVALHTERAMEALPALYMDKRISFNVEGSVLRVNDFLTISQKSLAVGSFVDKLRRKGVRKVVIREGVTYPEFRAFVLSLIPPESIPKPSTRIEIEMSAAGPERQAKTMAALLTSAVQGVKTAHRQLASADPLEMGALEDLVAQIIEVMKDESTVLEVLRPHKASPDYQFFHSVHVTVLSIYLAKAIGLTGDTLNQVGLAGLLYDVGSLFVPREVLDKEGDLDEFERTEVQKHPLLGAMYLAALEDVPKHAVIAAFEHHMNYDGSGYPATKWRDRQQHIVSQIIAVADFFDALRTNQPYRKACTVPVSVSTMEACAGRELNPILVRTLIVRLGELKLLD